MLIVYVDPVLAWEHQESRVDHVLMLSLGRRHNPKEYGEAKDAVGDREKTTL